LRSFPLGEQSNVVVLLTRARGKVRAVAKGVRAPASRYQSALEPMSEIRVALYGRETATLFRLGAVELLRGALRPRATLEALAALECCAELTEALVPEGQPDDDMYRLGRGCLTALRRGPQDSARDRAAPDTLAIAVVRYAEAWSLRLQGLYPALARCAQCHRPIIGALAFDPETDRVVCAERCRPDRPPILDPDSRAFLRLALRLSPRGFAERAALIDLSAVASYHAFLLERHLGRSLRSPRVLAALSA
jgi:DNA repair protein RecO (recombination protein O)